MASQGHRKHWSIRQREMRNAEEVDSDVFTSSTGEGRICKMLRLTKQWQLRVPQMVNAPEARGFAWEPVQKTVCPPRAKDMLKTTYPREQKGMESHLTARDQFSNPKLWVQVKNCGEFFSTSGGFQWWQIERTLCPGVVLCQTPPLLDWAS